MNIYYFRINVKHFNDYKFYIKYKLDRWLKKLRLLALVT